MFFNMRAAQEGGDSEHHDADMDELIARIRAGAKVGLNAVHREQLADILGPEEKEEEEEEEEGSASEDGDGDGYGSATDSDSDADYSPARGRLSAASAIETWWPAAGTRCLLTSSSARLFTSAAVLAKVCDTFGGSAHTPFRASLKILRVFIPSLSADLCVVMRIDLARGSFETVALS